MKRIILPTLALLVLILASCESIKEPIKDIYFDEPFPKRNKDLTKVLGQEFMLKNDGDTLSFKVRYSKDYNLITNKETSDTVFLGRVSKFRGLYFFSEKDEVGYNIHAVRLDGNLLYGFRSGWLEKYLIEENLEKGDYDDLIIEDSEKALVLRPVKSKMKRLFSAILGSIPADTIIRNLGESKEGLQEVASLDSNIDFEELENVSSAYPNPVKDFLNLKFRNKGIYNCSLLDINGKVVASSVLSNQNSRIDCQEVVPGTYILILKDVEGEVEKIKIVKW